LEKPVIVDRFFKKLSFNEEKREYLIDILTGSIIWYKKNVGFTDISHSTPDYSSQTSVS